MADKELKKIYGSKWAREQREKDRVERKKERQEKIKYKNAKKQVFNNSVNTGLGIMEIILILILVIVVGRILFGSYNNDFTFATFFEELISFEGINIQNWLRPEYSYPEGVPTWLIDFLNWQVGNQNTFALLIGSIANCGYFIVHILYIIFGI